MSCRVSCPFSRPFQHSVNSLVCWLNMRRWSHFCTFLGFRTAWRIKIYRSISQMSSSHVSGTQVCPARAMTTLVKFPTIFEVYPVRTSNSKLDLQPFLCVYCMRWGLLWKLPKRTLAFTLTFPFVDCSQLFIINAQFHCNLEKKHPILLLLYFFISLH